MSGVDLRARSRPAVCHRSICSLLMIHRVDSLIVTASPYDISYVLWCSYCVQYDHLNLRPRRLQLLLFACRSFFAPFLSFRCTVLLTTSYMLHSHFLVSFLCSGSPISRLMMTLFVMRSFPNGFAFISTYITLRGEIYYCC